MSCVSSLSPRTSLPLREGLGPRLASTRALGIFGDTGSYSWARCRLELWFYQELEGENAKIR